MNTLKSTFISWYFNDFVKDPLFVTMNGTTENSPWHRESSVGIHTNMVVTEYLTQCDDDFDAFQLFGAFAAAFHDVGKPAACVFKHSEERGNYKAFHGHEGISARLWEDWAVRNWHILKDQFNFNAKDIYSVGWLIEHHLPWGIKKPRKVDYLVQTACAVVTAKTFTRLLRADTWGRLADDASKKRQESEEWIVDFEQKCEEESNTFRLRSSSDSDDKPVLVVPIAASGSGKSTHYNDLPTKNYIAHYSWDDFRLQWYSSDYAEAFRLSCEDKEFKNKVNKEFSQLLKTGTDIYFDNINVSSKRRFSFIDQARKKGYYIIAQLLPVSLEQVLYRQHTRLDKTVPDEAVERQYMNLQLPQLGEFDEIIVSDKNIP